MDKKHKAKYMRIWHKKNPKRNRELIRNSELKKPELYKKINREKRLRWVKNNPEKAKFNDKISKQKRKGVIGSYSIGEWELLLKQYGYTCPACGKKEPEIKLTADHIIPITKGGFGFIENI